MSSIRVFSISNRDGSNGPNISGISTVSTTGTIRLPVGVTTERVGVESGSLRYNSELGTLEFYNGTSWLVAIGATTSVTFRGVFGGGTPGPTNTIDYITIASTGNAIDFGDLTVARNSLSACSSSTRGVFGGGFAPTANNTIDYITIATTGNAIDFGDLTVTRQQLAACSNGHGGLL